MENLEDAFWKNAKNKNTGKFLSDTAKRNYSNALKEIIELLDLGNNLNITDNNLFYTNAQSFPEAKEKIMNHPDFLKKDKKGSSWDGLYSCSLNCYERFLTEYSSQK